MFIKVASSPGLSGIGMPSPILWSHLLKMQRIVLLSSLLWWELGTNPLIKGPGEWLSFRRFTRKLSWSWSNMIFHSLTFARSRGRCWKPRAKPEVFNILQGTLRMLTNYKIMFDRYYCINSKKTHRKLRKCLRTLFLLPFSYARTLLFFYKYPQFGPWPGTFSHDDLKT